MRRIGAGLVLAAFGIGCVFSVYAFDLLVLAIGLFCLHELSQLCDRKGQPLEYPVAVFGVCAYVILAAFGLLQKWEGALLSGIIIATFWLGMYGEQIGYFARTAYTLLGVLYVGKLLSYFVLTRSLPVIGLACTLYVVTLVAMTDIMAMLIGSLIGRTPMTKISPKKTIEGSLGALIVAAALGGAGSFYAPFHLFWWQGVLLGAITSVAAQAGDLAESALKRDAGVKDTGTVIQGHGGVLDRFDSYFFGGMAFYGGLHVLGVLAMP